MYMDGRLKETIIMKKQRMTGTQMSQMLNTHRIVSKDKVKLLGVAASAIQVTWTDDSLGIFPGEQTAVLLPKNIYEEASAHFDAAELAKWNPSAPLGFE
jgi:hypothetical protein